MTKICPECGEEFTPKSKDRQICYKAECYVERNKRYSQKNRKKYIRKPEDSGKVRPYSFTSNMLLAEDIQKGMTLKQMAKLYDRDIHDLKRHIEKITSDGTIEKIIRRKINE